MSRLVSLVDANEPILMENKVRRKFWRERPQSGLVSRLLRAPNVFAPSVYCVESVCALPYTTCRYLGHVQEGRSLFLDGRRYARPLLPF